MIGLSWEKITKGRAGIRWDNVVEKKLKDLGGDQGEVLSIEIFGVLKEDIGMETYLHGPMDNAKKLKLRFRVGDLDLPERRDIPVVGRRRTWSPICARMAQQ